MLEVENLLQFKKSLVQGIMLRLVEFCYGYNYSQIEYLVIPQNFDYSKEVERKRKVQQEMKKYLEFDWYKLCENSLNFSLNIV